MNRRRGKGFGRGALAAEAVGILIMFDALLAFARKLAGDDEEFTAELATLEQAVADAKTQEAADQQALADLKAKVDALGAPVDTSAFALKTDIPDVSGLAKQSAVDAINAELVDLDTQIAALGQPAATPGPAPAPTAESAQPAATADQINAPLPGGPITATSGQPDTTQPAAPADASAAATGDASQASTS
jgi:hypothetical protein